MPVFKHFVAFVNQHLVLRDKHNELVSRCGKCCCGRRMWLFVLKNHHGWMHLFAVWKFGKNDLDPENRIKGSLFHSVIFDFYVRIFIFNQQWIIWCRGVHPMYKALKSVLIWRSVWSSLGIVVCDYCPASGAAVEQCVSVPSQGIFWLGPWPHGGVVLQELRQLLNPLGLYGASQQGLCVGVDEEGWDGAQQCADAEGTQAVVVRVTWKTGGAERGIGGWPQTLSGRCGQQQRPKYEKQERIITPE